MRFCILSRIKLVGLTEQNGLFETWLHTFNHKLLTVQATCIVPKRFLHDVVFNFYIISKIIYFIMNRVAIQYRNPCKRK